jgi:hypothetical protein
VNSSLDTSNNKEQSSLLKKSGHQEWQAMMDAFENHPHLATDALVLGQA